MERLGRLRSALAQRLNFIVRSPECPSILPTAPRSRRIRLGPLAAGWRSRCCSASASRAGCSATDDLRSQLDLFTQVLSLVQNNYVDAPDNQKLIKGAIDGMLKTLDPHTVFLPPQRAERSDEKFQGEYSGIGIQFDIRDGKIVVISPLEGTPAYRLGIRAGDKIVAIDGKPLAEGTVTTTTCSSCCAGPTGSMVQVDDRARRTRPTRCSSRSSAPRSRSRACRTPT